SGSGELASPSVGNGYGYTVYVAGRTKSSDFPVTSRGYDGSFHGGYDGVIFRISSDLSELYVSTYLGGSRDDNIYALTRDRQSKILVAGYTASADYPVSSAAYSNSLKGGFDLFISKLSADLDYLLFSSYFGGTSDDYCRSIITDSYDNVYLTGWTQSTDFPVTSGAFSTNHNGGLEAIVCKISSNLQVLLASTYLGGMANDLSYALALDDSGNVYVTGYTSSSAFPLPDETYDDSVSGTDAFVAKFGAVDQYLLTVNVLGSGQVVSHDGGIDTSFDNSQVYDTGTKVILEAAPAAGYIFGGWGGDVHSTDATLTLTMNSDKVITAKFAPEGATYTLTVVKSGSGSGTVTSDDEAINCGTVCSQSYTSGTLIKLTATPDENSGFEGWSGDISSTSSTVPVIINGDMTIIAVFGPPPLPDLTGEWHDLKITRFLGRTTIITGFFELKNISEAPADYGYKVSYYLSSDGISLDIPLNTRAITLALLGESSRKLMFTRYVEGSVNVSGKYLVAVIDPENVLTEESKTNNLVVYGPLP
ncbi:MAG TPA: SBBP repeat-containing protein, partial [Candidatus Saccharicenans sp.]|nr:SBBP repeat-containing protein [Candidatus Saccharicenans sp.]